MEKWQQPSSKTIKSGAENLQLPQFYNPSKIKWDLANGPLSKLLPVELVDTQV